MGTRVSVSLAFENRNRDCALGIHFQMHGYGFTRPIQTRATHALSCLHLSPRQGITQSRITFSNDMFSIHAGLGAVTLSNHGAGVTGLKTYTIFIYTIHAQYAYFIISRAQVSRARRMYR